MFRATPFDVRLFGETAYNDLHDWWHMFSIDGPGIASNVAAANIDSLYIKANFSEFVRVSFNGIAPEANGVKGSRASNLFDWNVHHELNEVGGFWVRSTGAAQTPENHVTTGHRDIDIPPS